MTLKELEALPENGWEVESGMIESYREELGRFIERGDITDAEGRSINLADFRFKVGEYEGRKYFHCTVHGHGRMMAAKKEEASGT